MGVFFLMFVVTAFAIGVHQMNRSERISKPGLEPILKLLGVLAPNGSWLEGTVDAVAVRVTGASSGQFTAHCSETTIAHRLSFMGGGRWRQ